VYTIIMVSKQAAILVLILFVVDRKVFW